MEANNTYEFEKAAEDIGDHIINIAPSFEEHFRRRIVPVVREFVQQPTRQYSWLASRWTNNACESINNILKLDLNWRPQKLLDLIEKLHNVVRLQFLDLRRSLCSAGNYEITPSFRHYCITEMAWQGKSDAEKQAHFDKFLKSKPSSKAPKTITSKHGDLQIPTSPLVARKPGQRKRPKTERAQLKPR